MYSTSTKERPISVFICFSIFHFGQIKMIFRGDESLKKYLLEMSMFVDIVTK